MIDVDLINRFLQEELQKASRNEVGAVEAAKWLDRADLLKDSKDRPERNLRRLLLKNLIHGQEQLPNGRWTIRLIQPAKNTPCTVELTVEPVQFEKTDLISDVSNILSSFRNPSTFTNRAEAIQKNSTIPRSSGIYAWYFRNMPEVVPVEGCTQFECHHLLYVGISPRNEEGDGNIRQRIQAHFGKNPSNNASRSTLRFSLGCLLSEYLNINLQRADGRIHFGDGEGLLSEWMAKNAMVAWYVHSRPWDVEQEVIERLSLPLNLDHNTQHQFYNFLHKLRTEMKKSV